ncbi:MAG TPA: hypothetical protein VLE22_01245 [Bryobacteraceae bacterium]|nr:hypothetical protein [Bryobacteraceae bacterium]
MNNEVSIETLAHEIYRVVGQQQGKRYLKAGDLTQMMMERFGERCSKDNCRRAIHQLIDSGRCVYSYFGASYITLPHKAKKQL